MNAKDAELKYEFLASFFLPDGMLDWFEITKTNEEDNEGTKDYDILFPSILEQFTEAVTQINQKPEV